MTRAQLIALLNQKVLTGGRRTTAQFVRDVVNALISSDSNKDDDADLPNGYAALDVNGRINIGVITDPAPSGKFLKDDGTWGTPAGSLNTTTLNITASAILDLTGLSGTVLINMTSGSPTPSVKAFANFTGVDVVYVCPASGVSATFDDLTTVSGGNFKLSATPLVALGTMGGFIKFIKRGTTFYQEAFIDQYV